MSAMVAGDANKVKVKKTPFQASRGEIGRAGPKREAPTAHAIGAIGSRALPRPEALGARTFWGQHVLEPGSDFRLRRHRAGDPLRLSPSRGARRTWGPRRACAPREPSIPSAETAPH